ncbi:MAG: folate family ECF transporter S component [Clostridia bacterium]|nr:folate family ECF transporter S component [Clostridia bacterium]
MQKNAVSLDRTLYKSPFSKAYWVQAAAELKDTRMLVFAALMIGIRSVMKLAVIPLGADLNISFAFLANAFGAMVFGPVLAAPAACVSDFLGYLISNPSGGPYYPPFILTEVASSVIFALFLYRADITVTRVFLSKFCINFFVNLLLQTPIMRGYYAFQGKSTLYPFFDGMRLAKNVIMLPIEAIMLVIFLRAAVPAVRPLNYVRSLVDRLTLKKRHIVLLAALFAVCVCASAGYVIYDYNHKSFSANYTQAERLQRNNQMNAVAAEKLGEKEEDLVTVIQSARSRAFQREMTYEVCVYRVNWDRFREKEGSTVLYKQKETDYTMDLVRGYSKSPANGDDALVLIGSGVIVTDKHTDECLSADIQRLNDTEREEAAP